MDYDKLFTSEDKVIYRFFLLATLFLSPSGLLYVVYYAKFSTINMWSFIFIIPLLSTPLIIVSYIFHSRAIENRISSSNLAISLANETKKTCDDYGNFVNLITKYIKKKLPFSIFKDIKNNCYVLIQKFNKRLNKAHILKKDCEKIKKEFNLRKKFFLIDVSTNALIVFYFVSIVLIFFNFFIYSLELKYFLLIQYSSYSILFLGLLLVDFMVVKKSITDLSNSKNIIIQLKKTIEVKTNEIKRVVDHIKKDFEEETKGLKKNSNDYEIIVTKYSRRVSDLFMTEIKYLSTSQ